jgi:hypothetical protein
LDGFFDTNVIFGTALAGSLNLQITSWKCPMTDFARKPVESARTQYSYAAQLQAADLANEKHYSVGEVATLWSLSVKTVRKMFESEPGVIQWGSEEALHKRGYRTLRIPESILQRVHRKLRRAS